MQKPELYVVGAGPGDPDLITVKGQKALMKADVILYDNLANKDLLDLAPESCEKIYVGKHPYGSYTPQERILELIKEKAFEKGCVLRLKGGDPFVFGRGFEEILYARAHGIETHFIPGISSMQALGFYDIPLTHRNVSESLWVITGTKKDGNLSDDLKLAMQSKATVIIYMGMKKLPEIVSVYSAAGRGDMPAAIVQHASHQHSKSVRGKVSELLQLVEEHQMTHPSLIVIGKVASLANAI